MSLDSADISPTPSPTVAKLDIATPRMEEADLRDAGRLSLRYLRPPAKVPGYEQEQFLGRGAFGEVWKAVDSNSGRTVAIKFYSHRGGLDWSHMAREVEKLQYLFSDRYVVQLFGVGWEADPPYYVMEYMPYGSLEDRLRKGPMAVAEAVRIIRETARGLVHAHDKGILHCDLKPSNIMLDQEDRPRLADFGQARLKHDRAASLGTLFYMAPEQADLTAMPDARWDVYALGTILYRMVTGELPYLTDVVAGSVSTSGPIEERLRRYREILRDSPAPTAHRHTPGVDRALAEIIDHCLHVDPKHRYRNIQSVLTALDTRETKKRQRSMLLLGLLGPALVVFVMGFVAAYLFQQTLSTARRQLLNRTLESDQFAAKTVAAQFGMGLDKRWRILEQEATNAKLRQWLGDESNLTANSQLGRDVDEWLRRRHTARNLEFTPNTTAAYWFILDRKGIVRAISPPDEALVGKYFGYREYFHGQGRELPTEGPAPSTITASHRSNVFRSQPTNRPAVAFSTPIFRDDEQREIIGIIAMETELGHFSDFEGSRNQFAVLVDLRPDQSGKSGLVIEHPFFERQLAGGRPLQEFYLQPDQLATFQHYHDKRIQAEGHDLGRDSEPLTRMELSAPMSIDGYRDPIDGDDARDWLAALEPVVVFRGPEQIVDSGWAIIVQELRADTLEPFEQVRAMVRRGGWAALGMVFIVVGALWGVVLLVINTPQRLRRSRFFAGFVKTPTSSSSTSLSSRSEDGHHRKAEGN